MSALTELPSIARLQAAAQSRTDPSAGMMALLSQPALVTLSGPPELASLVGIFLAVRAASAGCSTVYSDLVPADTIGRQLWAAAQVNQLEPGAYLTINRDPIVANHPDGARRAVAALQFARPKLWILDNLQSALADTTGWDKVKTNPGITLTIIDPDQAALSLLQVADEMGCAVLALTSVEPTCLDTAADIRLAVTRTGRTVTLAVTAGATPGPIQFELTKHGGAVALRLLHPETST